MYVGPGLAVVLIHHTNLSYLVSTSCTIERTTSFELPDGNPDYVVDNDGYVSHQNIIGSNDAKSGGGISGGISGGAASGG